MNKLILGKMLIVSATLFIAACDFSMTSEIFTSDLYKISRDPTAVIMAPQQLNLEMSSKQTCEEKKGEVIAILTEYFGPLKDPVCTDVGMDTFLTLTGEIPLFNPANPSPPQKRLAMLLCASVNDRLNVELVMDRSEFERLSRQIKDKFMTSLKPEKMQISMLLHHDGEKAVEFELMSAYLNNHPYPYTARAVLNRREKATILLSTILTQHILIEGKARILSLPSDDKETVKIQGMENGKCQRSCRLEGGTTNETGKRKKTLDPGKIAETGRTAG